MSIRQTREGFNYQDYITVYVFLKEYLDSQIQEFYADFIYNETARLSHDIYYVTTKSGAIKTCCIEVKTGDRFCAERELIGKALCEIYNFLQANSEASYTIYISKDFREVIGDCWLALKGLKEEPLVHITPIKRLKINLLKGLPHLKKLTIDDDDIRDYISRLTIENPTESVKFSSGHDEGIELAVEGLIRKLGRKLLSVDLSTQRNPLVYPYNLTQELIYITAVNAGTNTDLLPYYREAIASFFGLAQQSIKPDFPSLDEDKILFDRKLREHEGLVELPHEEASLTEEAEIGVPQL